jgi:hypothetical protein
MASAVVMPRVCVDLDGSLTLKPSVQGAVWDGLMADSCRQHIYLPWAALAL